MNAYYANHNQLFGVEEYRLVGGRGDGMRMLSVRNACGLAFLISLDRAGDIVRLSLSGVNYGYFAPCGFVAPTYYNKNDFLASFTAGFFTTCGLSAVGTPCHDAGEDTPLHGTVSHIPCETVSHYIDKDEIRVTLTVRDASLFGHALLLRREYIVPIRKNEIRMTDCIQNIGTKETPLQVLYHCNMGYPLLSERAELRIPSDKIRARNTHAEAAIDTARLVEKPQRGYEEMCYYYEMEGTPTVTLYNPDLKKGVSMTYDTAELPFFTEWKMMGEGEYVMGLEPGNCLPDGRDVMRQMGRLETLAPGAEKTHRLTFSFPEEA